MQDTFCIEIIPRLQLYKPIFIGKMKSTLIKTILVRNQIDTDVSRHNML